MGSRLVTKKSRRWALGIVFILAPAAFAQSTDVAERIGFEEAVRRALEQNRSIAAAAQAILQAETFLQQVQTVYRPTVNGTITTTVLDSSRGFDGLVTQPRTQGFFGASASYPILAAARWAQRAQAEDQIGVARLSVADVRRQIGAATAQAYLGVIAQQRLVEVNVRARENAVAHLDYARARLQGGAGSRLNELRAAQELETDEVLLESARLALRRAQEALGVLVAANRPIDASGEPGLEIPRAPADASWLVERTDVKLLTAQVSAAARVLEDSWRDWVPTGTASFEPQLLAPSGLFSPSRTWRALVTFGIPILDGGARRIVRRQRDIAVGTARIQLSDVELRAQAERRAAEAAVESADRGLQHARLAAQHATEVLSITNVAFRAGATTNIELIDAQRRARDADTAAAQAEDRVRQARLELLVALGQFPR